MALCVTTYNGGAREGNFVDVHVKGEGSAGRSTVAWHYVDDTRREAGLFSEGSNTQSGQRCLLGRFKYNRVALKNKFKLKMQINNKKFYK